MKTFFTAAASLIGIMSLLFFIGFISTGGNLAMLAFWGPKYQAIQRNIYTQSPSFILGNQADLEQQVRAYNNATDPGVKAVMRAGIQTTIDNLGTGFPVPPDARAIADSPSNSMPGY